MPNIFQKSLDTLKEGVASLKNLKQEKHEYKAQLARIAALPSDYHLVYQKMTQYMWAHYGGGNGYDMMALQADLLDLFEEGAASGKGVLAITGEDVAAFCDELLRSASTYTENERHALNREIQKKLKHQEKD